MGKTLRECLEVIFWVAHLVSKRASGRDSQWVSVLTRVRTDWTRVRMGLTKTPRLRLLIRMSEQASSKISWMSFQLIFLALSSSDTRFLSFLLGFWL